MIKIENTYEHGEDKAWKELYGRQTNRLYKFPKIWRDGFVKLPDMSRIINLEGISIPHWRVLPIDGKSDDITFFKRLYRGIWNVNVYLRKYSEVDYLPTRCRWHDTFGHIPYLYDERYSDMLRMFGVAGVLIEQKHNSDPELFRQLGNLYWHTIEFGLIISDNETYIPFGAGIISSSGESDYVLSGECAYRVYDFNYKYILDTDYITDDYQSHYFNIISIDNIYESIIKFIDDL